MTETMMAGWTSAPPREKERAADSLNGCLIRDRYRLEAVIGRGGMGAVYAAEHVVLGKRVALKLVHAHQAQNPHVAGRLEQEARAASAIDSDHVVQVFDAGADPTYGLFIVMPLLEGEDLESRLRREKTLSVEEALRIAGEAARGLAAAHALGIIHRDLKPANVFLCHRDGAPPLVKLIDFGIAKLARDAAIAARSRCLTVADSIIGTPQYMSPEQAQGLDSIDHRTDVYALGALLFEMISGVSPVPALASYEQLILHIVTEPRRRLRDLVPEVSPALDALVADMMALRPGDRPADMNEVRERIAHLEDDPAGDEMIAPRPRPRRSRTSLALAAFVLAASFATLYAFAGVPRPPSPPSPRRTALLGAAEIDLASVALRATPIVTAAAIAPVAPAASVVTAPPPPPPLPSSSAAPPAAPRPYGGTGITLQF